MDIVIRKACEKDLPAIINLAEQLGYPMQLDQASARFAKISKNHDHCLLVAQKDDLVVGWVHIIIMQEILNDKTGTIRGLIVDAKYQNQGIGKLLMHSAEEWISKQGCHSVRVNSNIIRLEAHKFYEKIGYKNVKTQVIFKKEV